MGIRRSDGGVFPEIKRGPEKEEGRKTGHGVCLLQKLSCGRKSQRGGRKEDDASFFTPGKERLTGVTEGCKRLELKQ